MDLCVVNIKPKKHKVPHRSARSNTSCPSCVHFGWRRAFYDPCRAHPAYTHLSVMGLCVVNIKTKKHKMPHHSARNNTARPSCVHFGCRRAFYDSCRAHPAYTHLSVMDLCVANRKAKKHKMPHHSARNNTACPSCVHFGWSMLGRGSSSAAFLLPRPDKGILRPTPSTPIFQ